MRSKCRSRVTSRRSFSNTNAAIPEVIIGDRTAGPFELHKEPRVVLSRLPAREQNSDGGLGEDLCK